MVPVLEVHRVHGERRMIEYPIGASGQVIVLADAVLAQFHTHRQTRWLQRESGGQLFARFEGSQILVVEATGPRAADRRTTTSFLPSRRAEQREIDELHRAGLHYIGDWHTHREDVPTPSATDIRSIHECFARSNHDLVGFVLVVVGRCNPPKGLHVSVHGEASGVALVARPVADATADGTPVRREGAGHAPPR